MNGTVHYALVAFWEKSGCKIVADYPADGNPAYRVIALSTVGDLKTIENDKISVDRGKYTVHVLIGELHYVCLTAKSDCPSSAIKLASCSRLFLERLRSVYRELPMLADLSSDLTDFTVADLSKPLKKIIEEYNNQSDADSKDMIPRLKDELDEIRRALMDGIQKLIDRGQRLEELVQKTQTLQITAWFRGISSRNHIRMLHEKAMILQRHWRGYHARLLVHQYLIERVRQMRQDHRDRMAMRIQAAWRGYWSRKTQINFLQIRRWLKAVYMKNDEILENMRKFRQGELEHVECLTEQESMLWILFILFKLHHLLRTECRPGVITRIDKTRFAYIEEMLRCFEYDRYIPKSKFVCRDCQIDLEPSSIFCGAYFEKCEKEIRELEKSLRAGSVFTSYSFEERVIKDIQYKCFDRRYQRKNVGRCLHKNFARTQKIELYEAINRMDCQLDRLHLNCPIHNLIS